KRLLSLLVLSQVMLSFQLPFAIIPLVQMTGEWRRMGPFANGPIVQALAWASAAVVIALNVVLIALQMQEWAAGVAEGGASVWWIYGTVGPVAGLLGLFLGWVGVYPYLKTREGDQELPVPMPELADVRYRRIGVGVELSAGDAPVLAHAATLAREHGA